MYSHKIQTELTPTFEDSFKNFYMLDICNSALILMSAYAQTNLFPNFLDNKTILQLHWPQQTQMCPPVCPHVCSHHVIL